MGRPVCRPVLVIDTRRIGCYNDKKQKGADHMGWANKVICQLKGYVRAHYGEGALFFG